ncbi:hypothetical protein NDU88_011395 [Pleurodeles waltl]|uniref:Uncharacterized protein n=1 Tax=Pleurodeles waltl TaxID=8319 RepID=A0AAV7S408_PLEWA|nr:hypothetical protein NDU88_011395 [Pleurodeles waltl]
MKVMNTALRTEDVPGKRLASDVVPGVTLFDRGALGVGTVSSSPGAQEGGTHPADVPAPQLWDTADPCAAQKPRGVEPPNNTEFWVKSLILVTAGEEMKGPLMPADEGTSDADGGTSGANEGTSDVS